MYKKIAAIAGASAILMTTAIPAFAYGDHHRNFSLDLAWVKNSSSAEANTGFNIQGNAAIVENGDDTTVSGDNHMTTGNATAEAKAAVVANTHAVINGDEDDCECANPKNHADVAKVDNSAWAGANTGYNIQGNVADVGGHEDPDDTTVSGNNTMTTGDANSTAKAFVLVNTHLVR